MIQTINNTHVGPVSFAISSCHHKINDARTQTHESQYPRIGRDILAFRSWNKSASRWYDQQCDHTGSLHAARFLCGGYPR